MAVAVKAGRAGNLIRMVGEPDAALSEAGFEGVDIGESLIGSHLTQQRPKVLSRVQLGCVGRQESEPEVVWHGELRRAVPGSAVEHKESNNVCR